MTSGELYLLAADLLLVTHALFVVFVVLGLAVIIAGGLLSWPWVRNPWFRVTHVAAIGVVVLQAWLGRICPLTIWEMALRTRAGGETYPGSFIAHWISKGLYYDAPAWVFTVLYTTFGAAVVAGWYFVRPHPFASIRRKDGG